MKLELTVTTKVFDGSETKETDTNTVADSTYLYRDSGNGMVAATATKDITPDNMAPIKHLTIVAKDESVKFNLILTDSGGAKTLVDLQRQVVLFGAWTGVSIVAQSAAVEFDYLMLGV